MKIKNTNSFFVLLGAIAGAGIPLVAFASKFFDPDDFSSLGLGKKSPEEIIVGIINFVLGILALIAVTLIIYAGFRWMLSRGNEEQIEKAKGILRAAFIGLLIILASAGITKYVLEIFVKVTR